jgi:hypothetical protein
MEMLYALLSLIIPPFLLYVLCIDVQCLRALVVMELWIGE